MNSTYNNIINKKSLELELEYAEYAYSNAYKSLVLATESYELDTENNDLYKAYISAVLIHKLITEHFEKICKAYSKL